MIELAFLLALAAALTLGYHLHRALLRAHNSERSAMKSAADAYRNAAEVERLQNANRGLTRIAAKAVRSAADAALDAEWAAIMLAVVEGERDTYQTAFRGLTSHLARQELTTAKAEEPVGRTNVVEMRRGR